MAERGFVVGLSGVPDAGKTTIMQLLARRLPRAHVVSSDYFQTATRMRTGQARNWFARSADPNVFEMSELVDELARRTQWKPDDPSRPLVFLETPFARLHRASGAFIDLLVWIDTPLDVALSRATLAFVEQAQNDPTPNAAASFLSWQRRYLLNYQDLRAMYETQRKVISASADLIIDGARPAEISAAQIVEALAARGVQA